MVNDLFEVPGAPGSFSEHRRVEPFSEYLAQTAHHTAPEPPHQDPQANAASCTRQI
jgi:hypothetical protein